MFYMNKLLNDYNTDIIRIVYFKYFKIESYFIIFLTEKKYHKTFLRHSKLRQKQFNESYFMALIDNSLDAATAIKVTKSHKSQ